MYISYTFFPQEGKEREFEYCLNILKIKHIFCDKDGYSLYFEVLHYYSFSLYRISSCTAKPKRKGCGYVSSKQTQAALCCSVACWNANRGICPLHLLCLLSRCQELTDKASVTALVTFTVILTGIVDQVL